MYRKLALLICAALSITVASAQTESVKQKELFHNYSKLLSPEKVYLHTDKDVTLQLIPFGSAVMWRMHLMRVSLMSPIIFMWS